MTETFDSRVRIQFQYDREWKLLVRWSVIPRVGERVRLPDGPLLKAGSYLVIGISWDLTSEAYEHGDDVVFVRVFLDRPVFGKEQAE